MQANKIFTCDNRGTVNPTDPDDPGLFIPVTVGELNNANPSLTYTSGRCFKNIKFTYAQTSATDATITIDTENAASLFCMDWFFIATSDIQHVESFYLSGAH